MNSIAQTAYRPRHSDEAKQPARSIEAWERRHAYEPRHETTFDTHVRFDRRTLTWRHNCPGTDDCSRCQAHIEDRESAR